MPNKCPVPHRFKSKRKAATVKKKLDSTVVKMDNLEPSNKH